MSMTINTNVDALNALRNLTTTGTAFSSSVQKLSSGLRINTAADDAAGLAIATKLSSQVTGLNQAQRNAQDGVSMVQTAEGALNQVQTMLQRIRELAVEAANSTLSTNDAQSVNNEVTALQAEITRTATSTQFNGQNLLTGSLSGSTFTVGGTAAAGSTFGNSTVTALNATGANASTTYTLTSGAGNTLTLSNTTNPGTAQTITLAAPVANKSQVLNFSAMGVSLTVTEGGTADNAGALAGSLDGMTVVTGAATGGAAGATFQIGANEGDTLGVNFSNAQTAAFTGGDTINGHVAAGLDAAISDFTHATTAAQVTAAAGALITAADSAIGKVSSMNSGYGAVENRLNDTVATLSVTSQNLNASQSRIKDLNVAAEMVNFTKTQILQQAGTAILAQANSASQNVMTLLR